MNIQKRTYQPTNQTNRKNNKHNQISKQATRHNVAKQNRTQNQQEATSNNSFLLRFTVFAHLRKHKGAMCGGHRKLLRISAESNIPKMKLFVGISILQLWQKGIEWVEAGRSPNKKKKYSLVISYIISPPQPNSSFLGVKSFPKDLGLFQHFTASFWRVTKIGILKLHRQSYQISKKNSSSSPAFPNKINCYQAIYKEHVPKECKLKPNLSYNVCHLCAW